MAQTYMYDIPSIRATHPALPPVIGNLDLNQAITAGQPISQLNLDSAQAVAKAFTCLVDSGVQPLITPIVSESANLRAIAIESAHASIVYTPLDMVQALHAINNQLQAMNNRFTGIEDRLTGIEDRLTGIEGRVVGIEGQVMAIEDQVTGIDGRLSANTCNIRIIAYNSSCQASEQLRPLQKTVAGNGLVKADHVRGNLVVTVPDQNYPIGAIPPNFNGNIATYQPTDILDLIVFYNEDFSIVPGDTLAAWKNKLRDFLTGY